MDAEYVDRLAAIDARFAAMRAKLEQALPDQRQQIAEQARLLTRAMLEILNDGRQTSDEKSPL